MVSSEKAWSKLTSSRKSRTEPTVDKKHTFWFNKREKIHNILLTNKKKQAIRTKQCSRVVELKFKAFTKIISPVRHLMTWKCGIVRLVKKKQHFGTVENWWLHTFIRQDRWKKWSLQENKLEYRRMSVIHRFGWFFKEETH